MATIQLAEYKAISTAMSTELNALTSVTGRAIASTAVDNTTELDLFDDLELAVTWVTGPTSGTVDLYLLPSIDGGTTYADGSSTVTPQAALFVGAFVPRAVTTAQKMVMRGVALPPGFFKYFVQNTTNQALPATGSTLRRSPYQLLSV